jgi:hypothetical protein
MFDVYLNDRRDLLVVPRGLPIPAEEVSVRWRKRRKVVSVSDEIRRAVQSRGYYMRRLKGLKNDRALSTLGAEKEGPSDSIDLDATTGALASKSTNSGCKPASASQRNELRMRSHTAAREPKWASPGPSFEANDLSDLRSRRLNAK